LKVLVPFHLSFFSFLPFPPFPPFFGLESCNSSSLAVSLVMSIFLAAVFVCNIDDPAVHDPVVHSGAPATMVNETKNSRRIMK